MGALNPLRDFRRLTLKGQLHVGVVVDGNDPLKQQRVRIRIPQLHRGIPDSELPWMASQQSQRANAGKGVGTVSVPPKGAKMYVRYDADDPHSAYYGGSPTHDDVSKENELLKEDYPHSYGHVDQAGDKQVVNTQRNTRTLTHRTGATFHVGSDGSISMYSPADLNLSAKGRVNVVGKQSVKIHSTGDSTSVKGKKGVDVNSSDAAANVAEVPERQRPKLVAGVTETA